MSLSLIFLPTVEFLAVLATAIVLWFGGRAAAMGTLEIGVLVAFLAYVTRFFQPVQELSQLYTTMQSAMAGGERVLELLDARPDVADPPDGSEMPTINGRIELRRVNFCLWRRRTGIAGRKPVDRGRPNGCAGWAYWCG